MTSRNYYVNVGIFTLLSTGALVALILVLSSGDMFAAKVRCETYLTNGVNGLQVGSPVKFNGVPVGEVTGFGFPNITYGAPDELFMRKPYDQWVTVYFEIKSRHTGTSMDLRHLAEAGPAQGLRAQPALAGITGGAFINLQVFTHDASAPLSFPWTPEYVYIPSAPSTVDKLLASIEKVAENLSRTDFAGTIRRIDDFFGSADALMQGDLRQLIVELRQMANNLERLSQRAKTDLGGVLFGQPPPRLAPSNSGAAQP